MRKGIEGLTAYVAAVTNGDNFDETGLVID